MGRSSHSSAGADRVTPRAKLWLEVNRQYVFGLGISEILKAIQHTGSIKSAAHEVGKSYRHVWDKIKQAEQALGVSLVRTQVGGKDARRSELSEFAQDLLGEFEVFRQRLLELVEVEFAQRLRATIQKHLGDGG
jgi:molybdate transport repressor ModE-like protein